MRRLVPVLFIALAACTPTTGTPAPGVSPGATAAPATSPTGAAGTAAPTTSGTITDLATRFPLPGAERHLVYNWTRVGKAENITGTDDLKFLDCSVTSCNVMFTRTENGVVTRSGAQDFPALADGVAMTVTVPFFGEVTNLAEALKKGGTTEEEVTVKAGTFKTTKVTYGGTDKFTFWIQKPWIVKAVLEGPINKATLELDTIK